MNAFVMSVDVTERIGLGMRKPRAAKVLDFIWITIENTNADVIQVGFRQVKNGLKRRLSAQYRKLILGLTNHLEAL